MLYSKQFIPIIKKTAADTPLLTLAGYCSQQSLLPLGYRVQQKIWQSWQEAWQQLGGLLWRQTFALPELVQFISQSVRSYKQLPLLLGDAFAWVSCHVSDDCHPVMQQGLLELIVSFCQQHQINSEGLLMVEAVDAALIKQQQGYLLNAAGKNTLLMLKAYTLQWPLLLSRLADRYRDDQGLCWPAELTPFDVLLLPIRYQKSYRVREVTDRLHLELEAAGYCVLLDDRKERPGVMLAEGDLLGFSHQLVIGEKALDRGMVEYKHRASGAALVDMSIDDVLTHIG